MSSRWLAMICACHISPMHNTLMTRTQITSTRFFCDSEAGICSLLEGISISVELLVSMLHSEQAPVGRGHFCDGQFSSFDNERKAIGRPSLPQSTGLLSHFK